MRKIDLYINDIFFMTRTILNDEYDYQLMEADFGDRLKSVKFNFSYKIERKCNHCVECTCDNQYIWRGDVYDEDIFYDEKEGWGLKQDIPKTFWENIEI